MLKFRGKFLMIVALVFSCVQGASVVQAASFDQVMSNYYRSPDPAQIQDVLAELNASRVLETKKSTISPAIGFFAALFKRHPDHVETWISGSYRPRMQHVIAAALNLAGARDEARAYARSHGFYDAVAINFEKNIKLEEMGLRSSSDLDAMWGASFASGEDVYVRRIFDMLERELASGRYSEDDVIQALDVMEGRGNKAELEAMYKKYGRSGFVNVIMMTSAAWSIRSNAKQHEFIAVAVQDQIATATNSRVGGFLKRIMAK